MYRPQFRPPFPFGAQLRGHSAQFDLRQAVHLALTYATRADQFVLPAPCAPRAPAAAGGAQVVADPSWARCTLAISLDAEAGRLQGKSASDLS